MARKRLGGRKIEAERGVEHRDGRDGTEQRALSDSARVAVFSPPPSAAVPLCFVMVG
jgi:hypothetical protein